MDMKVRFGENIAYDLLNFYVSRIDKESGNDGMSQAAWKEILKHHIEKPDYARVVAKNIVVGIIESQKISKTVDTAKE